MQYAVNIGTKDCLKPGIKKDLQPWWEYCVKKNIITGGFDGEYGDEGTSIFRDTISNGSLIFAYANEHGFVGVGIAESRNTYKCLDDSDISADCLSHHNHHRSVRWLFFVDSLSDAVRSSDVGGYFPRSTLDFIQKDKAEEILKKFLFEKPVKIKL